MSREHYHNQQVVTVDRQQGVQLMKKTYNAPKLTNHGSVETITQMFGNTSQKDFLFFSAGNNAGIPPNTPIDINTDGSVDGIVVPKT
jgi:hypothetical protein